MKIKILSFFLLITTVFISCKENVEPQEFMVNEDVMAIKLPPPPPPRVDQVKFVKPVVAEAGESTEEDNGNQQEVGSEVASQQKNKKIIRNHHEATKIHTRRT